MYIPTVSDQEDIMSSINQRGDALKNVPNSEERLAALEQFTVCGPNYRRRVVDELSRARRMWWVESAGACLVTAEIAAGLRPSNDYQDRHTEAVYKASPGSAAV
ncbi:hypothetical protein CHR55_27275 [Rhodococcus qingshengii]|uniref:Uncharacterized protein n=2 Tax=Rhodococcus qingshengii TaxID=334542 RepID=A0A2A5J3I0_RHOSG|nr:hypothetical protein CHR55_27275 [Rhodococcus qingshengii]